MISFTYNLNDVSSFRTELMGWAIIWIMMLHFTFTQIMPLGFIAQYGFSGVDIFMMVSGFGLYYSLEKDNNILHFYKKRLLRIFPTYYFLNIGYSFFIEHDSIPTYLFRHTTIGYWTGGVYGDWFIPSIVALYLLTPLLKKLYDKGLFLVIVAISLGCLFTAYYIVDKEHIIDRSHFFFIYRIPAFIFGMACAYWLTKGIGSKYFWQIMIVGIPLFAVLFPHHHEYYNFKYFSLLFLLPVFTTSFILISKNVRILNPLLAKIGEASLEIYLIQGYFFYLIINGYIPNNTWHDIITSSFIIASTTLGIIVHWLIYKIFLNKYF